MRTARFFGSPATASEGTATTTAGATFGSRCSTSGSASRGQSFRKLLETNSRFIRLGQFGCKRFQFGIHLAEEIKVDGLSIEQVLYVDEDGVDISLQQQFFAGVKSSISKSFQTLGN